MFRVIVHVSGALQLAGDFVRRLLEFLDALAKSLRQLRQFFGTEEDQDDRKDQDHFPSTEAKDC